MTAAFVRSFNGWAFDCVRSENHNLGAVITESPSESGSNFGDHMYAKQAELTIVGIVSNTPLYTLGVDPFSGAGTTSTRRVNALALLRKLQTDGVLFDVQTGLMLYQNMGLENISVPDDAPNAGWGEFTLKLKQVTVTTTANAAYQPSSGLAGAVSPGAANGTQQATPASGPGKTLAAQGYDIAKGWLGL
jgi:hypothetical protein